MDELILEDILVCTPTNTYSARHGLPARIRQWDMTLVELLAKTFVNYIMQFSFQICWLGKVNLQLIHLINSR